MNPFASPAIPVAKSFRRAGKTSTGIPRTNPRWEPVQIRGIISLFSVDYFRSDTSENETAGLSLRTRCTVLTTPATLPYTARTRTMHLRDSGL